MAKKWSEKKLQSYIKDGIEEEHQLEYKAAGALDRTNEKKVEITKDISSMAHSAGGVVIYGIREFPPPKKHLPEKLDPIDRIQYPKEWLEQIINLIRPPIPDVVIHPVSLSSTNDVAYVVEVPQASSPHQALDQRYYKRFNFQAVPMKHEEIMDIMNRTTVADASVRFESKLMAGMGDRKQFLFMPLVSNSGKQIINNFKLTFKFLRGLSNPTLISRPQANLNISLDKDGNYFIDYHSVGVLFATEERPIGEEIGWTYDVTPTLVQDFRKREAEGRDLMIPWTLYADNMPPKHGEFPLGKLHDEY